MPVLHWLTRAQDVQAAGRVPLRLLREDPALAVGEAAAPNLLVQGDNLEALRALLPLYAGQVKCVFIDPPYNTGAAFAQYDDNLAHTTWLAMMVPRLALLREFLSNDGSIWVTIDDTEAHYLKVVMDEVFGRDRFIANVFWQKTHTRENRTDISASHDHLLVYAMAGSEWKKVRNMLPSSDAQLARFENPDNDPRGPWASLPAHAKAEVGRREEQFYEIVTPSGRRLRSPEGRCWLFTRERFDELVADNRIWFGEKGNNAPRVKKFLSEVQAGLVPTTFWPHDEVGSNGDAKAELVKLALDVKLFSTPKPEALLHRILHIATNPNDLVLDSFLGSGTTAAVAHKMGRRWIGIEMGAHALTHCHPRLAKVVAGEGGGVSPALGWAGGGGFRTFTLGDAVLDAEGRLNPNIPFAALAGHLWFALTGLALPPAPPSPVLGVHEGRAIALLHNGVLGDKRPAAGNVLTRATLALIRAALPAGFAGPLLVLGEAARLSPATLMREGIAFRPARAVLEAGR